MGRAPPQGSGRIEAFLTNYKGTDAMRTHRTLYLLAVVAVFTGCRTNGGAGWSVWNPFSRWSQDTAVAGATPELPSQQFAEASKSPAAKSSMAMASATPYAGRATSSAPAYTPPTAVARAAEATPTAPRTAVSISSAPAYTPQTTSRGAMTPPASNTLASGMPSTTATAAGPYDPNGYQPATTPAAPESTSGVNRYGMPDRYATSAPSPAPVTSSESSAATTYPGGDRYATYESSAATTPPTATTTPPATTQQVEQATAMINLTTPPGQYRPAGTSSYSTINMEQVNVASLPEKPASTTPTTPVPATPTYPSTGTSEPGSIYGVPAYR